MNVLDLFSGIGGFSLGLERAGMRTVAFCEIEPFPRAVLAKHWPHVPCYHDVHDVTADRLDRDGVGRIDLICGGYPCQPFSHAGKQRGHEDPRHLWPQMRRVVGEVRPAWVLAENVVGHITLGLDQVLADLETDGYAARAIVVPACAKDAPHIRQRVWIMARGGSGPLLPDDGLRSGEGPGPVQRGRQEPSRWLPEPRVGRVAHGIPRRMDRLRALGNAVVPQVVEEIGRAIMACKARRA